MMEDVSRSYVDGLGETNDGKRLKDNLLRLLFTSSLGFVMRMFASFVKLLRPPLRRSFQAGPPNLRFAAYERVALSACKLLESFGASLKECHHHSENPLATEDLI